MNQSAARKISAGRKRDQRVHLAQDLQRDHHFAARRDGRLRTRRAAPTENIRSSADSAEHAEVDLRAGADDAAPCRAIVEVGGEAADEHRRPHPRHVEPRRAEASESAAAAGSASIVDLTKLRPPNLVQLGAGQAVGFAIALLVAVIDVVVAEAAEEEVGERLFAIVRREARRPAGTRSTCGRPAARTPRSNVPRTCVNRSLIDERRLRSPRSTACPTRHRRRRAIAARC